MSFVSRKHIDRRTFLRGSGAAIALPWLDAMTPAFAAAPETVRRCVFVYAPNGMKMDDWTPRGKGTAFKLPYILAPLSEHRKELIVFSRLALDGARAHGDGPGDHARSVAAYLTTAHPKKTGGADIRAGISVDQVLAGAVGGNTVFPSLELGMEGGRRAGACDSGYSCAYSNNVAWRNPTTPVPKEVNPREVFARLFGSPDKVDDEARRQQDARRRKSVLDLVLEDTKALGRRLGQADRDKIDGYLTAVRELERRMVMTAGTRRDVPIPKGFIDRGGDYPDRLDLMYDLIALALRADLTRVVTFMLGNAGSNRSYRFIDVKEGHHNLSHHGKKPDNLAKIRKINRFHVEHFSRFLRALKDVRDGDRNLLENSMVLYGSGIADGDRHAHHDLPILLAGRAGGRLTGGRHLSYPKNTPLANLYVEMLKRMDVPRESFGDSTGGLARL